MTDAPTLASASPWAPTGPVASFASAESVVTLVEGQTFCLSGRTGDIVPDLPEGLFVLDTRVLSRWELRVNGALTEALTVAVEEPFAATFVTRVRPLAGKADADLVVFRQRHIGMGMREQLDVRNYGSGPVPVTIELRCDVDFADLFEVKESRVTRTGQHHADASGPSLRFGHEGPTTTRAVTIRPSQPPRLEPGLLTWHRLLAPGERWDLCLEVVVEVDGVAVDSRFRCGGDDDTTAPSRHLASWRARIPTVETDNAQLAEALDRSSEDLGALRIFDPERPELAILAAGAPWFMTVFGRDSLLTAWMTLIADPSLARGVLETLARFQGSDVNPETEEEPGKILHEMRFGSTTGMSLRGGHVYYGSVDATPLFVMLLGELRRWGLADDVVDRLLPHADRALDWIEHYGDADGDGYVEYQRSTSRGLANQGWKDSFDGVRFADGRFPQTPIALCEVQGYAYAAWLARAHFAEEVGDHATFERCRTRAAELRRRFNEDFWLDEHEWFAMGLDADKRPIDGLASNMGHCLWTGIIEPERAAVVARRLVSPELSSGWGIRTLATSMAAYNPVSYHNGSVWPHDNALCAAGLVRYGFVEEAHQVLAGQLAVAAAGGGRLPELFAGFGRAELAVPAAYPTSCSPQAWAAASPLLWLRTLLQLEPWAPHDTVWVAPNLPDWIGRLRTTGIEVAGSDLTIDVDGDRVEVSGAGPLTVRREPRHPVTSVLQP